jgi:adenine-specific DNA-methyltransferase
MAKKSKKVAVKRKAKASAKPIEQYEHLDKERVNNPHIGLVNESTDTEYGQNKKTYQYDPHLDPQLQWAGKAERTSFEVPVVSLHVHERIDPKTIIESVKKDEEPSAQFSLFEKDKKPLREAIEFYKHKEGWSNRLIAGDSLLIMNSLLEKEGMGGKVQMVYFDPPYGIKYGSNFQPFVNKRDVKDGSDEDLTQEPEMIRAFRDTWELGIHSYLSYMRDRLQLANELLHESGSIFVQISDENLHHVREIMDEVFTAENLVAIVCVQKAPYATSNTLPIVNDYICWYAKNKSKIKYRQLFKQKQEIASLDLYRLALSKDGKTYRNLTKEETETGVLENGWRRYRLVSLVSQGGASTPEPFQWNGKTYYPPSGSHWKVKVENLKNVGAQHRLQETTNSIQYRSFMEDFPVSIIHNIWTDTITGSFNDPKVYVVQTGTKTLERCTLMATDPGDLVLDITCGSGTTAFVAEQWGRRWITCDTSRVAIALAKQRLLTANFEYYKLARQEEGIGGAFQYKTVPHITLKTIANNEPAGVEVLFDQPLIDNNKTRVTGPFTVESIPAPFVKNLDEETNIPTEGDAAVTRTGETLRQDQWRDELQRTGARGKGGAMLQFSRIEAQEGTRYIQAVGETKEAKPQKVLIVFGPEHAPLDARVVELAIEEARQLKPNILLFCAFQFDEEAAKDIDETSEKLLGFKLLKAHMNMDLQTDDLKKQKTGNQSFWLIGQPDVRVHEIAKGDDKGKVTIEVAGFDYYNPKTGAIDSGGSKNIAMWMLDSDYDGRSLFPRQIFFPMAGPKDGWARLAKNLKAEIDEEKIEAFRGTVSLPFTPGKLIAVKIIDDRGIESLKIIKR